MLNVDDAIPSVSALAEVGGFWRVLFFFPRAATTHCQMQARRFEALMPQFEALGVRVVGLSSDTEPQHRSFRDVCKVSFPLVSDADGSVARAFGVLEEDVVENETTRRAKRRTFLVSPQGRVVKRYDDVDPNTHAAEVLEDLRALKR